MNIDKYSSLLSSSVLGSAALMPFGEQNDHVEVFHVLMKYFVGLRRRGKIDDKEFRIIAREVAAYFIESEISKRVDSVLVNNKTINILLGV
jgi:hypothetical protein